MCQITYINEIGDINPYLKAEQVLNSIFRKLGITLFITSNKKYKSQKKISIDNQLKKSIKAIPKNLKSGDIVRIHSKEQILKTLDENNKLNGCFFMDEMWQYCGSKQRVLKRVEYFLKEADCKMLKASNIVLLEGIHCSGKLSNFKHSCDRNCNFFWKEEWLEKIE